MARVSTGRAAFFVAALVATVVQTSHESPAAVAASSSCSPSLVHVDVDLSTGSSGGIADSPGTVDTDWALTRPDLSTSTAQAESHIYWAGPGPSASWIEPSVNDQEVGTFVYTYRFVLPPGVTAGDITMTYAADNGVDFALNGTNIGPPSPPPVNHPDWWDSTRTFTATSPPYVVGLNELTATVVNFSGPTGLLIDGTLPTCWSHDVHCVSDGLIVRVAGADVATVGHAETHSLGPAGARPAGPVPAPPGAPTTSSDGTLLSGSVPLVGSDHLDYDGVIGSCEASLTRPDVYGRAGALDVELVISALGSLSPIRLTDLMTEAELYLDQGVTGSGITCTTGHATAGTTGLDTCVTTSAQVVNIGTVKALIDERWGPYVGSDGFIHYGGTALHLVIDMPLNADVEVIVGSVDLRIVAPSPPPP